MICSTLIEDFARGHQLAHDQTLRQIVVYIRILRLLHTRIYVLKSRSNLDFWSWIRTCGRLFLCISLLVSTDQIYFVLLCFACTCLWSCKITSFRSPLCSANELKRKWMYGSSDLMELSCMIRIFTTSMEAEADIIWPVLMKISISLCVEVTWQLWCVR